MRTSIQALMPLVFLAFTLTSKAQFTEGNIVALKVASKTNLTGAVSLAEFSPSGSAASSVTIPSANTAVPKRLTISGTNSFEGQLNLSEDGRYLCFGGYNAPPSSNSATQGTADKVIAKVGYDGTIDLGTRIPASIAFSAAQLRSVVSRDGTSFWGNSNTSGAKQGIIYINAGDTVTTSIDTTKGYRALGLFNGILYASSSGIAKFSGVPTSSSTSTSTGTYNANFTNNSQFVFLDTDSTIGYNNTPYDVLYIANSVGSGVNTGDGISKFYCNAKGTAWVFAGVYDVSGATVALPALTGKVNAFGQPVLYAIKGNVPNNAIISIVDASGRTVAMSASNTTVDTIVNAGASSIFKGVAFAPKKVASPLPIKLSAFSGVSKGNEVVINWQSSSEINAKEYVIEKSTNNSNFSFVGVISAKGVEQSSYQFTDSKAKEGIVFYRLKMEDNSGIVLYSNVISLNVSKAQNTPIKVYPNPAKNSLTITHSPAFCNATIDVIDESGKRLIVDKLIIYSVNSSIDVSHLSKGSYIIHYNNHDLSSTCSFIKE